MTFRIFPPLLLAQAAFSSLSASTMSNINGGMGRGGRSALSSVDFYRRVPKDLTEVRVIDSLSCWFCDPSNSKQEPATAQGTHPLPDGAFPLVMCVESWYKTAFQLEF